MTRKSVYSFIAIFSFVAGIGYFSSNPVSVEETLVVDTTSSYIVQGQSTQAVAMAVRSVGADITHELGIIRSVGATLTAAEAASLRAHPDVRRIFGNDSIEVAANGEGGGNDPTGGGGGGGGHGSYAIVETDYASLVNADSVHAMGITARELALPYSIPGCGSTTASNMIRPAACG
jgi:hypothetical protein